MKRRAKAPKLLTPKQQAKMLAKQQQRAKTDAWLKAHPKTRAVIYAGSVVFVLALCGLCANIAKAGIATPTQSSPTQQVTQALPTTIPTHIPKATPTKKPTPKPTTRPTQQVVTHPTPSPQPTNVPTPKASPTPSCQAINNNPWCYNFTQGKLIYYPPSNFCSYFNCITSFWEPDDPGDGYVVQCQDGRFSQSGGESGACSYHGGVLRPLFSH